MIRLMLIALLGIVSFSGVARAQPASEQGCPYLPQYRTLRADMAAKPAATALTALYAYAADPKNENPAACEAIEIDQAIGEREVALVTLVGRRTRLQPRAAFHCDKLEPGTLACNGTVADGTGQPDDRQILGPRRTTTLVGRIDNRLPLARLIGVYRSSLAAVQTGKPPTRLALGAPIRLTPSAGTMVLIAVFSGPLPSQIRKIVWYY